MVTPARHLAIFARAPRYGAVKRRLAHDLGRQGALAFHRWTLGRLLRGVGRDPRWQTWLFVTPDRDATDPGLWPAPPGTPIVGQGAGDLGARMMRPLRVLPPGPVVIVGADIPEIRANHVAQAFAALGRHDLVFGPAADGGYWLVGARRVPSLPRGLFAGVRWGTRHALSDTLGGLPRGCRVARLETLDDVDDGVSYARWKARTVGERRGTSSFETSSAGPQSPAGNSCLRRSGPEPRPSTGSGRGFSSASC